MAGPAIKQQRRKTSTKSKATTTNQHTSSTISSFARVSKSITTQTDIKKENQILASTPKKDTKLEALTPASRKRKVVASIEEEDTSADETPTKLSLPAIKSAKLTPQSAKRSRGRPSKKSRSELAPKETPKKNPEPATRKITECLQKKRARSPSVSDSDESTINAGVLLKRLRLESSPSRCSSPLTANTSVVDSEADDETFSPTPRKYGRLPEEVLALADLHSSLLKTLTLHYAHNGSNVPADLRVLCPNVARAWGKKKVTDSDIRICLGVLNLASNNTKPLFSLSNYGRGKICIEIDSTQQIRGRPIDEKKLNDQFHANLTPLWTQFISESTASTPVSTFLTNLPKAPVALCDSVIKAEPVLAKGQKRLEELKHGIAVKKQEKETKQQQTNPDGSKMSLLDRIRLKSLQKSNPLPGAANLTPEQIARRAALQRAPEVAAMLGMLSRASAMGGDRVSFTMATTLEKLKDSMRMGISREEGTTCVRLLASEVAPEWIRVVAVGGRENVVLETDRQISRTEVEGRVRRLLEKR
ncbi:uncharacterized protein F4822DRAFT_398195 [Hypoxylon trugodes]|uniref:uncharacterized protein n=1 Tax=Hypoxylon trugodes TaxID=326681 RepID=UPI00218FFE7E|nr:uncharacterized protein F4822DRAFT_398195 [Hypoxylon trugodes]KAI1389410.1 hypothetical protein F4822DRAFT_398195 [Hypoxylon trugodes]